MKDEEYWESLRSEVDLKSDGVFIINEGNFQYENASLSYYDLATGEVYDEVFFEVNGIPLGDVALSMVIRDSLGYVVVNNSGKVYVLNVNTFQYEGKITGLTSPRYMHFINDSKAYVTDLYARSIAVVNAQSLEVVGHIDVSNDQTMYNQHPTEQMVQYGKYVFTNCWSFDNKILVIDSEEDRIVDSIEVLIQPASMVMDRFGKLWVLTDGGFEGSPYGYEEPGLIRIDAEQRAVEWTHRFQLGDRPSDLAINAGKDTLYFLNRHAWRLDVQSTGEPELFFESPYPEGSFGGYYGLAVDPASSEVYLADAIDQVQPGIVYRLTPRGLPLDTLKAGIAPGTFCFKPSPSGK
jgi:DNA-binding beta-propeller fold protein YncE